jgi:quinol monooxygenase YgiN
VAVERVTLKAGQSDEYLAWRRDAVLPFLASQQGFLSSTLLSGEAGAYVVVEKWTSPEARQKSLAGERAAELRAQQEQFVGSASEDLTGRVVDVFRGRS